MRSTIGSVFVAAGLLCAIAPAPRAGAETPDSTIREAFQRSEVPRGLCVVLGLPRTGQTRSLMDLTRQSEWTFYFQSESEAEVADVRRLAESAGMLGTRIFAARGAGGTIHLAGELADVLLAFSSTKIGREEALRVVRPGGCAVLDGRIVVKPAPAGVEDWSHPYHGPDNNPQSSDQLARAPFRTQFCGGPMFGCMPEISVASGGRVFRAFGHLAFKSEQNQMLNTLLAFNGYNGTVLWRRPLREGFMIHRNTLVATPRALYLADDESCKILEAASGRPIGEIVVPAGMADGKVWKWMAIEDGRLYALVGGAEIKPPTHPAVNTMGVGHWPWEMWPGFDYHDPRTNFGFGRTFLAVDLATRKILWHYRLEDHVDSRGTCMRGGRIYFYCPGKALSCLDARAGKPLWRSDAPELLKAVGRDRKAQWAFMGFSTTTYVKCNDAYLFFAGPQRATLVAVSTADGKMAWEKKVQKKSAYKPTGFGDRQEDGENFQLVLRDDALYALGCEHSLKLDYATGKELGGCPTRTLCTRATGTVDSIYCRGRLGSTLRFDVGQRNSECIAPMRPSCMSGVIAANGRLYWGPWVCGCQISLFGNICLAPAGDLEFQPPAGDPQWERGPDPPAEIEPLRVAAEDWSGYRPGERNFPSPVPETLVGVPAAVHRSWGWACADGGPATPAVTAGGLVFFGQADGTLCALRATDGGLAWKAYTGGQIKSCPTVWNGRLYAGSGDGWVYAFEAASGKLLWRFRPGPAERRIPFYGRLVSTWPVAGGVAVADGTVYAAAGIAHYDGTYVVALDAVTGKLKWKNDSPAPQSDGGLISLGGPLYIQDGLLFFAGGNAYGKAAYDLKTGKLLAEKKYSATDMFNLPKMFNLPGYQDAHHGELSLSGGRRIHFEWDQWDLRGPAAAPAGRPPQAGGAASTTRWRMKTQDYHYDFVLAGKTLLTVAEPKSAMQPQPASSSANQGIRLIALAIENGSQLWALPLPAKAVEGGVIVDRDGRVVVSLMDGQVACFSGQVVEPRANLR